jgi:hypothetical protein
MKTTVIYHRADFDGIFCREIARRFVPATPSSPVEFIGWDYGDPEPVSPIEETVYILDLSVPTLMGHPGLIWIDHHKSAIDRYASDIPGYRIDGVAACRLAWRYFDPTLPGLPTKDAFVERRVAEPYAVRLAGEYDIWDKRDPNAERFQHGLRSVELSENMWDLMLVNQEEDAEGKRDCGQIAVEALLERGEAVQYAQTRQNESIIREQGFTVEWEGLTFLACNHARYNSLLFTAGLRPEHDACLGFKWTGRDWSVSLYHAPGKEHIDLSVIAVKCGGGGHRGACGFRCASWPWLKQKPKNALERALA